MNFNEITQKIIRRMNEGKKNGGKVSNVRVRARFEKPPSHDV